ncbi:2Fe-2S iron-sulfur cluster-binding protein [Halomonas sp. M20]|uniref:2Fe-2S iron-sulfur cluster-binding protein n=1 Tax=Halomonas sp. M20 TaxID=2763264 RepID=UPI001D0B8922|nr:2Fe-2S iron-sulfur cluster-binding protein [Halomonas sp. M20]
MKQITIEQWPHPVEVSKGTILDAALKAGVPYPHDCRSGECGQCKTQLVQGEVRHDPCLADALSSEERKNGLVLACRCQPKTDIVVCWQATDVQLPIFAPASHRATVHEIERVSRSVVRLWLTPDGAPMKFMAGQYARLRIGDLPARSYSMANLPGTDLLEFHIAHLPEGVVSDHIAQHLQPGDAVHLEGPFGTAYLRDEHEGPLLAVAGGTGLAPILAILRSALSRRPQQVIHLYYGVRERDDIHAEEELGWLAEAYPNLQVHIVLRGFAQTGNRQMNDSSTGSYIPETYRHGTLHQVFAADFDSLAGIPLYIAGSPGLVEAVREMGIVKGVSPDDIHADVFRAEPGTVSRSKGNLVKRFMSLLS